jgi:mRNA interferase MazF
VVSGPKEAIEFVRQGEVYWLDFGATSGSSPAERHPCVVVQSDLFNRSHIGTTVVCLITSNLERGNAPGNVTLRKGDANLAKASVVNVSQIVTIDKSELVERVTAVQDRRESSDPYCKRGTLRARDWNSEVEVCRFELAPPVQELDCPS